MRCDQIVVSGVDTDNSPYDSGSYASSTTYITGMAAVQACGQLREKIVKKGSDMLGADPEQTDFDGAFVYVLGEEERKVSLADISTRSMCGNNMTLEPRHPTLPLNLRRRLCAEWQRWR